MAITRIPAPRYATSSPPKNTLSAYQRGHIADIASKLSNCTRTFVWDDTTEGADFWYGVVQRLTAISQGEPLKE